MQYVLALVQATHAALPESALNVPTMKGSKVCVLCVRVCVCVCMCVCEYAPALQCHSHVSR
jgi:hypothetical protein